MCPPSFPRKRESMLSVSERDDVPKVLGCRWIPAFAGMTSPNVPAFAGMTSPEVPAPAFAGMTDLLTVYRRTEVVADSGRDARDWLRDEELAARRDERRLSENCRAVYLPLRAGEREQGAATASVVDALAQSGRYRSVERVCLNVGAADQAQRIAKPRIRTKASGVPRKRDATNRHGPEVMQFDRPHSIGCARVHHAGHARKTCLVVRDIQSAVRPRDHPLGAECANLCGRARRRSDRRSSCVQTPEPRVLEELLLLCLGRGGREAEEQRNSG